MHSRIAGQFCSRLAIRIWANHKSYGFCFLFYSFQHISNSQLVIHYRSHHSSGMEKEKSGGIERLSTENIGPLVTPHDDR